MALAHMFLPVALEMEQEPSPVASEQELSTVALEQMPSSMCNSFELLSALLHQIQCPCETAPSRHP